MCGGGGGAGVAPLGAGSQALQDHHKTLHISCPHPYNGSVVKSILSLRINEVSLVKDFLQGSTPSLFKSSGIKLLPEILIQKSDWPDHLEGP